MRGLDVLRTMKRSGTLFSFAFTKSKQPRIGDSNGELETETADSTAGDTASQPDDNASLPLDAEIGCEPEVGEDLQDEAGSSSLETAAEHKKKFKTFQVSWMKDRPWLRKEDDGSMMCTLCLKHGKSNTFTKPGCKNYRTTTLNRHVQTSDHKQALQGEVQQSTFSQAAQCAVRKSRANADESVVGAMRTVYWMAKEDVPIKKYPSLIKLLKLQGCEAVSKLSVAQNATYSSRSSGEEFQRSVAGDIHGRISTALKEADMFSILVDESTDISVSKHLGIYVRVLDADFVPHTYFFKNVTIENPKSDAKVLFQSVKQALDSEGLDMSRVMGFGSDGAAVMMGHKHGVAALIKEQSPHCINIHCMAHRFNLATSQASKGIPYLKEVESTLSDLYYYFGGSKSANRKCELEEIQKVLQDPLLKVKECHEIRWLAFFEAVRAVFLSWASLFTYFMGHDDSKAVAFRRTFKSYKFLAVLAFLMDILPSLAQLSMQLQKENLDVACVYPALSNLLNKIKKVKKGTAHYQTELLEKLESKKNNKGEIEEIKYKQKKLSFGSSLRTVTKEIEEIRNEFCDNLTKNIQQRFPSDTKDVACAFSVLCMRPLSFLTQEQQEEYGVKEIGTLADFYGQSAKRGEKTSKPLVDRAACLEEWSVVKQTVLNNMYPRDSTEALFKLLHSYHKESFPNILVLAKLALIMPYHTADCERGFSAQNAIKTARRSKMKEENLNVLMTIKCEGPPVDDYDFTTAAALWKEQKDRRIYKK